MTEVSGAPCMGCSKNMRVTTARTPKIESAFSQMKVFIRIPAIEGFPPFTVPIWLYWCHECTTQAYTHGFSVPTFGGLLSPAVM